MKNVNRAIRAFLITVMACAFVSTTAFGQDWDEQPSIKKSVSPDNPKKIEGMVMATIVIDEKGFVTDASIKKSTDETLEGPTLEAVKQWIFNPAKKGGSAIACTINVPFKFKS